MAPPVLEEEFDLSSGLDELTRIFATVPDDVGLPLAHDHADVHPRDDPQPPPSEEEGSPTDVDEGAIQLCTLMNPMNLSRVFFV
jgi:hypothetical protein